MRHFSKTEKQVIDYICDTKEVSNGISVRMLLEKFCNCSMQWTDKKFSIFVENDKDAGNILQQLVDIICLIEYLREEGLIYLFQSFKTTNKLINRTQSHTTIDEELPNDIIEYEGASIPMVKGEVNGHPASFALTPINVSINISQFVGEFSSSFLFSTETLKTIRNNDYKDDATIQHEESTCQTWIAIIVSIVIGVASILIGIHK